MMPTNYARVTFHGARDVLCEVEEIKLAGAPALRVTDGLGPLDYPLTSIRSVEWMTRTQYAQAKLRERLDGEEWSSWQSEARKTNLMRGAINECLRAKMTEPELREAVMRSFYEALAYMVERRDLSTEAREDGVLTIEQDIAF